MIPWPDQTGSKWPMPPSCRFVSDPMFGLVKGEHLIFVEIGSQAGWWAYRLLRTLPQALLYCVDPWERDWDPAPKVGRHQSLTGEEMYAEWRRNTVPFGNRVEAVRCTSDEAAKRIRTLVDFVFIDGEHTLAQTYKDLTTWVPKIRSGGVVVGHDIHIPRVRRAVRTFWRGGCKSRRVDKQFKGLKFASQVALSTEERLPAEDGFYVDKLHYDGTQLTDCFWRYV
jgi:predicted O-methyltransferase YrrM